MTFVVDLPIETEDAFRTKAAARGIELEAALVEAMTQWTATQSNVVSTSSGDELVRSIREMADKMSNGRRAHGVGPLPDNAIELDYDDREKYER